MRLKNLNPLEQQTARLLLWSALFNGVVQSLNQTQDIISRKALHATAFQLTLMTMIWPVSNLLSIWWSRLFERSCHKSRYFVLIGVFGRLSLIYGLWLTGMNQFMLLLGLMFSFNSLLIPAQNSIYQKNITAGRRGRLYGYTMSLALLVTVGFTFLAGRLLDINEQSFRLILAVTAVAGFIASMLLSFIRINDTDEKRDCSPPTWKESLHGPLRNTLDLLRRNKPFAAFERSFSIYGMGFIVVQPVLPIFLVDMLKLSYTGNFIAKGIISQLPILFLSPYLGKWHDKLHPFRFISFFFGLLALFPALIIVSALTLKWHLLSELLVYLAFTVFGVAMAGVNMAWNMGSIYFAGKEDASMYQSVHVTNTGIRGILAPLLSLLLYKTLGMTSVFVASVLFLTTASYISWRDYRRLQI
jgi:MFS family permease